jgi:hypothetical protein
VQLAVGRLGDAQATRRTWQRESMREKMSTMSRAFLTAMIRKREKMPMHPRAHPVLFLFLLSLSLLACAVLFSTFLSATSASNGLSSFSSFAKEDGELEIWRNISAFDRVAFIVIDALRSARVQVSFIFLVVTICVSRLFGNRIAQALGKTSGICLQIAAAFNLSVWRILRQLLFLV